DRLVEGYANDIAQIDYADDVNSLLSGNTSLLRLEYCIGGWKNNAYKNISDLVNAQGTGASSILYKNFKALKDAIPAIIAVNNDIEQDYEADSQSQFHIMLYDIGFKTTIAPYMNKQYWDSFVSKIETARPGAVDRNYLQCYGGGSGNNPKNWNIGNLPVYGSRDIEANPGLTHQEIVSTMTNWKNDAGIVGGFYWNYNYDRNLTKFSAPINEVFGGGTVADRSRIVAMLYPVKDYKAPQANFVMGSYTKAQIQNKGFEPNRLASIKLNEGVKMLIFTEDNFSGDSVVVTSDISDVALLSSINEIGSWRILANSLDEISGKDFAIKNKQSGFVLKPSRGANPTICQMQSDGTDYSIWTFELVENDLYKIVNKGSGKVLQTDNSALASYVHDGLSVTQAVYDGGANQHFIIKRNADNSYKLIPLSSLKYIGITDTGQLKERAVPVQCRSSSAPSVDWLLIPAGEILNNILQPEANLFEVYPCITTGKIEINSSLEHFSLKIIDLNGCIVLEKQQAINSLDISLLPAGVYILFFETGKQSEIVRIMKI
ncbi:MAG: RICIN domain-containing protein, partial [Dysgonamonadaceae bacterium]|nr:RICIN domain-containing protein [Dysgonamonadaceae bacterium]